MLSYQAIGRSHAGHAEPGRTTDIPRGSRQIATLGDASGTRSAQLKDAPPQLQERESGGRLAVTWNAARYRYLTISHVSGTERTTLAVNHEGGRTEMDVRTLPAGGAYEFALSDGLNSLRLTRPR